MVFGAVGFPCVAADNESFLVGHKYEVCECVINCYLDTWAV